MRPQSTTYTIIASDADGIATSQTPLAGGALTLDGTLVTVATGIMTLATAQHVSVSCAGADAARSFVVTGTDALGNALTETLTGSAGSITNGTENFKTVSSVTVDDATAGAVTVGVLGACELPWIPLDHRKNPFNYSYHIVIGTATFTVEGTLDDVQDASITPSTFTVQASGSTSVAGVSTTPARAVRVKVTAFTSGTVKVNLIQAGW